MAHLKTIHNEWKPLLKFTISFLFKQRVHLRRFSSRDRVDDRSDILLATFSGPGFRQKRCVLLMKGVVDTRNM